MIPRMNGWLILGGWVSTPSSVQSTGIITDFLMKCVVLIKVSEWSFFWSLIIFKRPASVSMSTFVLKLGSRWQLEVVWPISLQQKHLTFLNCWPINDSTSSFVFSSSSSSLNSCFPNLHPGISFPRLPQHHHISPPHVDWCVRHDQLKFSFSLNSLLHLPHIFD